MVHKDEYGIKVVWTMDCGRVQPRPPWQRPWLCTGITRRWLCKGLSTHRTIWVLNIVHLDDALPCLVLWAA